MRQRVAARSAGFAAVVAVLILPVQLSAKGDTVRIIIKGGDLANPIEITDRDVVARFNVWTGPGTFVTMNGTRTEGGGQGLIVDWSQGVTEPPRNVPVYDVHIVTTRSNPGTYIVRYCIDPATQHGYVYIPGKNDPEYRDNVWLILRKVEGNWFHAWDQWERLAHPLINSALK